jgi:hypothetical protein
MNQRIYCVEDTTLLETHPPRLIQAPNAAAAIRMVAAKYRATVPNGIRIAELVASGIRVEKA